MGGQPAEAGGRRPTDDAAKAGKTTFTAAVRSLPPDQRPDDDHGKQIVPSPTQLVSGAAPNLTHLMSRTTFAGATYNLITLPNCTGDRRAWPDRHAAASASTATSSRRGCATRRRSMPMAADQTDGSRGMPNLNLTEAQIDSSSPTCRP